VVGIPSSGKGVSGEESEDSIGSFPECKASVKIGATTVIAFLGIETGLHTSCCERSYSHRL
jgi:hypothetical protein